MTNSPVQACVLSTYHALRRGRRLLVYPPILIVVGVILLGLRPLEDGEVMEKIVRFLVGLGLGTALAWLWWSVMITHWKLWAYARVIDVHALRRRAVREKLEWPRGSFWQRTEIRSARQRAALAELMKRFEQPAPAHAIDDPGVPARTRVTYWQLEGYLGAGLLVAGGYFLVKGSELIGLLAIGVSFVLFWQLVNKRKRGGTFLVIDATGLYLDGKRFIPWEFISSWQIQQTGYGKDARHTLELQIRNEVGETELIQKTMQEAAIGHHKLEHLLDVYQLRHGQG